jgi:ribose transport system substrate-binding protein
MRVTKPMLTAALCAAAALGAAACGSSSSSSSSNAASSGATSSDSPGTAAAQQLVSGHLALATQFSAPGPAINGAKTAVAGKTIWYIPASTLPPWFQIEENTLKSLWSKLGATVQVCDSETSPTQTSTCLHQAIASHAAAIIADAVPVALAQDAFTAAVNAHIPVIDGYTEPSAAPKTGNFAKYFIPISGEQPLIQQLAAAEVITNSGGKANVLANISTDDAESIQASYDFINYLKSSCPGCTVATVSMTTVSNPNVASETSGAVLKNPNAAYFYTAYDAPSAALFLQGIRSAGRHMVFISTAGDPAAFARIKAGTQLGDVGLDPVYEGYQYTDAALRAITGMATVSHPGLVRVFTKSNLPPNPTLAGWASGTWFSNLSFEPTYQKLWGLS